MKRKGSKEKFISALLVFCMCLSFFPVSVMADPAGEEAVLQREKENCTAVSDFDAESGEADSVNLSGFSERTGEEYLTYSDFNAETAEDFSEISGVVFEAGEDMPALAAYWDAVEGAADYSCYLYTCG
ncbi:MAG: hypothetical protein HUJ73_05065, partial [Eubacterium sp.]|nr:hypothetical protein [Eubacterium sp.]